MLKRNNFYIESHHPLRETILNQMGKSEIERRSFLQNFYDLSTQKIPSTIKWKPSEYFGTELWILVYFVILMKKELFQNMKNL